MTDCILVLPQCIDCLLIGALQFFDRYNRTNADLKLLSHSPGQSPVELSCLLYHMQAGGIFLFLSVMQYHTQYLVSHQRAADSRENLMCQTADVFIHAVEIQIPLYAVCIFSWELCRQHQKTTILLMYPQQFLILFHQPCRIQSHNDRINKAMLQHRQCSFQLFPQLQIILAPFPVPVNTLHHIFQRFNQKILFHRLGQIFLYAKFNRLLCIIKIVIGGQDNKMHIRMLGQDFLHGINPIDARHLNVHNRNIRPKAVCQLNRTPSASCGLYFALIPEFSFYHIFQRRQFQTLVIRQHDPIHPVPPLGS